MPVKKEQSEETKVKKTTVKKTVATSSTSITSTKKKSDAVESDSPQTKAPSAAPTGVAAGSAPQGKRSQKERTALRIKLKSFNHSLLHETVKKFVVSLKREWSKFAGPIPLPTDIERFTVNRSPHVFKSSREQFEKKVHSVLIILKDPTNELIQHISGIELPHGVDAKIKVTTN
jgi:small subunit ribosomal protein S10